jgi:hypothetical protein
LLINRGEVTALPGLGCKVALKVPIARVLVTLVRMIDPTSALLPPQQHSSPFAPPLTVMLLIGETPRL